MDSQQQTECRFYKTGRCNKGNQCPFLHSASVSEPPTPFQTPTEMVEDCKKLGLGVVCPNWFAGLCPHVNCGNDHPDKYCELTLHRQELEKKHTEESDELLWIHCSKISHILSQVVSPILDEVFKFIYETSKSEIWTGDKSQITYIIQNHLGQFDLQKQYKVYANQMFENYSYWDLALKITFLIHSSLLNEKELSTLKSSLLTFKKYRDDYHGHFSHSNSSSMRSRAGYEMNKKTLFDCIDSFGVLSSSFVSLKNSLIFKFHLIYEIHEGTEKHILTPDFLSHYGDIVTSAIIDFDQYINTNFNPPLKTEVKVILHSLFESKLHKTLKSDIFYYFGIGGKSIPFEERLKTIKTQKYNPFYCSLLSQLRFQVIMFRNVNHLSQNIETIILSSIGNPKRESVPNMIKRGLWLPISPDGKNVAKYEPQQKEQIISSEQLQSQLNNNSMNYNMNNITTNSNNMNNINNITTNSNIVLTTTTINNPTDNVTNNTTNNNTVNIKAVNNTIDEVVDNRPVCRYGLQCFRKNPDHLRNFFHETIPD